MPEQLKTVHVIAGPNGAGKTTFVENYLNRYVDCDEFLNADLIAAGLSPFAPERQNFKASELFLERLTELEQRDTSFSLETTLAGRTYQRRIPEWKRLGFRVALFFLWLPHEEIAVQRVAERVAQGGHNIPEADVRRRYHRGLRNLLQDYLGMADDVWILDGSRTPPIVVWKRDEGGERIIEQSTWKMIQQQAKGNP